MYRKSLLVLFLLIFSAGTLYAEGPLELKVKVWAKAEDTEHWRTDIAPEAAAALNEELKAEGSNITVVTETTNEKADWGDYKKKFAMAAEDGSAPDIICSGHEDIATWAQAGYIIPLADSAEQIKGMAPEFDDVFDSLWNSCSWRGTVWAVPQDTEARPMFYSKTKLKALGWSDADIEGLPDKIAKGEFTLEDLIETAKQAIDKGVVEPGFGYWHRPRKGGDYLQYYMSHGGEIYDPAEDKLVITKDALEKWYAFQRACVESGITPDKYIGTEWKIWHDTVANDKALFWNGGIWQWADWALNYAEGGEPALFERVGYALQPASRSGGTAGTLSHPLVYMVTTEKASSNTHREIVVRLLQKMTTAELNTRHAVDSTHLGILKSQVDYEPYKASQFLADVTYMLNHNYYQPNHAMYGMWFDTVWSGLLAAEQGEKSPTDAAEDAVKLLQLEIDDFLIVK